jgi:hypothetical protein
VLTPGDARSQIDALEEARILEEEDTAGLMCFGNRIRGEPFPKGFLLPRDSPKYDGSTKPENWLVDYNTAVGIAHGNKRVAVRYAPLMLQGQARTWLNSLQAGSINSWPEFKQAFVRNFSTTYTRPGRHC